MRTKDPDKQHKIKEALVRLILREGIDGASVSKIAREAGVSPATIYTYYPSKERMLAEVFREYACRPFRSLERALRPDMSGAELIDALVRGYYRYTLDHEEVFSFVEQCSRCPTLAESVCERESACTIFEVIHQYQTRGAIRPYSDANIAAVLFAPVRSLVRDQADAAGITGAASEAGTARMASEPGTVCAADGRRKRAETGETVERLEELIRMLQTLLLDASEPA